MKEAPELVKTILDKANEYFDLSKVKYYEAWTHENTIPNTCTMIKMSLYLQREN